MPHRGACGITVPPTTDGTRAPCIASREFCVVVVVVLNFNWRLITMLWWFLPYIDMNQPWVYMCPHPEPPSHLPPHPIPLGRPSAPVPSTLSHTLNLDWRSVSHMVTYMFQCFSLKSPHPHLLPQSPKVCSLYLCLFCCLAYKVIVTIFLNFIYMH